MRALSTGILTQTATLKAAYLKDLVGSNNLVLNTCSCKNLMLNTAFENKHDLAFAWMMAECVWELIVECEEDDTCTWLPGACAIPTVTANKLTNRNGQ